MDSLWHRLVTFYIVLEFFLSKATKMAVGYVSRQSKSHHLMSDLHVYQRGRVDFKRDVTFMTYEFPQVPNKHPTGRTAISLRFQHLTFSLARSSLKHDWTWLL